jgi:hypothetical protein
VVNVGVQEVVVWDDDAGSNPTGADVEKGTSKKKDEFDHEDAPKVSFGKLFRYRTGCVESRLRKPRFAMNGCVCLC